MAQATVTTTTVTTAKKLDPVAATTKTAVKTATNGNSTTHHRVHPVHSIKRLSASLTTRKSTVQSKISADFTDSRTKLTNAENTLRIGLKHLENSKLRWEAVGKNMESFSENLKGVTLDEQHKHFGTTFNKGYEGAVGFHRGVSGITSESKGVHGPGKAVIGTEKTAGDVVVGNREKGVEIIKEFLGRIEEVKKEYPNVERSWSEMERYRRKNEKMEKKKNPKEEKKLRSIKKMENSRKDYHNVVDETVEKMKKYLEEYPDMCKVLYESYWKKQGDFADLLEQKTKALQTEAAGDLSKRRSLAPLPKKMTPIVPKAETPVKTGTQPTAVAPAAVPTKTTTDITPKEDPKAVTSPITETPKTSTVAKEKAAVTPSTQEAPVVKKMEEKISNAAKVGKDNTKPIDVSKTKTETNKPPSKLKGHHRIPSLKKMFKRGGATTATPTAQTAA